MIVGGLEFSHFLTALLWVNHPDLISIDESIEKNVDCFLNGVKTSCITPADTQNK
jgi:hypothetical protein